MANILKKLMVRFMAKYQSYWFARRQEKFAENLSFTQAVARIPARNALYSYMHHYQHQLSPDKLQQHRAYFKQDSRGFGEDAFHAMWFLLMREYHPLNCLEIGVYRGQVISLWAMIAKELNIPCNIHGISPFTPAGDQVSVYLKNIDYQNDTLMHHHHFGLKEPLLLKAFSNDPVAQDYIGAQQWNLIYIDGSHDYEVALADYTICRDHLADGGLLVIDDSSLYTDFQPPLFSFAGHPGPSNIVQELAMKELVFLGGVGHNNVFMKESRE
jgi:hypothetical protein